MLVFWVEQPPLAVDFMHITGFVTVVNRFVNYISLTLLVHRILYINYTVTENFPSGAAEYLTLPAMLEFN